MKRLEISSKPKQDGYARFMNAAIEAFDAAYKHDVAALKPRLDSLEGAYYSLEPFLDNRRDRVWDQLQQFSAMCYSLVQDTDVPKEEQSKYLDSFLRYKKYFREQLYETLFK
jgi:hypothetical protein